MAIYLHLHLEKLLIHSCILQIHSCIGTFFLDKDGNQNGEVRNFRAVNELGKLSKSTFIQFWNLVKYLQLLKGSLWKKQTSALQKETLWHFKLPCNCGGH